jgi:hypothetical protein
MSLKLKNNIFLRLLYLFFFSWLLFIIINLFFFSLISISVYKVICYENQLLFFIDNLYSINNKLEYFCYIRDDLLSLSLISNLSDYKVQFNSFFYSEELSIYFSNLLNLISFNYFFYLKHNIYDFEIKKDLNLIFLNFYIRSSNLNWIQSISLQKTIIINFNESSLFFFRIYNPSHLYIKLITLYMIYPNFLTIYINKIQCFCFNTIFLYPLELVDLPVLIYIYPFLDFNFTFLNNIIIYYIIFLN